MDKPTVAVYEAQAERWVAQRSPSGLDSARAFGARAGDGPTADLGCGPGWYSAVLPGPVAVDAAPAMLAMVPEHAPGALRVVADLEALPFRRGAFAAGWGSKSYVHVARASIPLALADLHRSLRVGAPVALTMFGGEAEGDGFREGDDFPGRFYSRWRTDRLLDVVVGAGFAVEHVDKRSAGREVTVEIGASRLRTLADHVGAGMRVLVCGLNPSIYAADAGVGYARPGNRFWPAALAAGLVTADRDPRHALVRDGVGMTDLVKRSTVGADELRVEEYQAGLDRLDRLAAWLQPGIVCFVGLAGWRAAADRRAGTGPQRRAVGGRPVYVMPSTSGRNAHVTVTDIVEHFRAAMTLVDESSRR